MDNLRGLVYLRGLRAPILLDEALSADLLSLQQDS